MDCLIRIIHDDFYEDWMKYLDGLSLEEFFQYKNEFSCIQQIYSRGISEEELENMKEYIIFSVGWIKQNLNKKKSISK